MASHSRSIVITGASTGIGEAAARRFDALGWRVFAGVRREEDGRRLAAATSDRLRWLRLDVTDADAIAAAAATVERELDGAGLDALVNNAGIAVGSPMEGVPLDRLRWQFEVNVFGLVAVTQAFIPLLRRAPGRIINIGSIAGRVTSPMVGPYCASKHAVEAITDALRIELAPWKIDVSVIEPGVIRTPIWDKAEQAFEQRLPTELTERYAAPLTLMEKAVRRAAKHGAPTDLVIRRIVHAATARRPRPRYVVGNDARLRLVLQTVLPRRWMDALIHRMIRRYGTPSR